MTTSLVKKLEQYVYRHGRRRLARLVAKRPHLCSPTDKLAEERLPTYKPENFYPARIGEVLDGNAKIVTKLGYGICSTVWLARQVHWLGPFFPKTAYTVLKIDNNTGDDVDNMKREEEIMERIKTMCPEHPGLRYIRVHNAAFDVTGPYGKHRCLSFKPMRENIHSFRYRLRDNRFSVAYVRLLLKMLLRALQYLHNDCDIIYTDMKPENVMIEFEDGYKLSRMEVAELLWPVPRKALPDRTVYGAWKAFPGPAKGSTVRLIDFETVLSGSGAPYNGTATCFEYRAPEITLHSGWSYPIDIWSLGVMVWDMMENGHPFVGEDESGHKLDEVRIAELVGLLGAPPPSLLSKTPSVVRERFFDAEGNLLPTLKKYIRSRSLKDFLAPDEGEEAEQKKEFLRFVKRILVWDPEERATAAQLLEDPWMTTGDAAKF